MNKNKSIVLLTFAFAQFSQAMMREENQTAHNVNQNYTFQMQKETRTPTQQEKVVEEQKLTYQQSLAPAYQNTIPTAIKFKPDDCQQSLAPAYQNTIPTAIELKPDDCQQSFARADQNTISTAIELKPDYQLPPYQLNIAGERPKIGGIYLRTSTDKAWCCC